MAEMEFSFDPFVEIQVAILPADKYAFKCLKSSKKQDKTRGNLFLNLNHPCHLINKGFVTALMF